MKTVYPPTNIVCGGYKYKTTDIASFSYFVVSWLHIHSSFTMVTFKQVLFDLLLYVHELMSCRYGQLS